MYWDIQVGEREKVLRFRRNYREEVIATFSGASSFPHREVGDSLQAEGIITEGERHGNARESFFSHSSVSSEVLGD